MDPLFPRDALVERLARADARAIVSAPPGFGKTTLLEAWARQRKAVVVSLRGVGPREAAAVAVEVAEAALARSAKATRIAFDDVAEDVVARVVGAVPGNVGLVVATRAAVTERVAFRDVIDLRALAFRGEELAREVGAARARQILAATGGWPQLVGAWLAGRSLADAARGALAGLGPELERSVGRLAAVGSARRAFLQFVAPQALGALEAFERWQLASPASEGDGGVVQIMGDALAAGRALLAEQWAAAEPKAYRDLQRRIGELLAVGARTAPAELVDRFARAQEAARVAELLARHGPALEVELARDRRSQTLVAWAELALSAPTVAPQVHVLAMLGRARVGAGLAGLARAPSEGERAALGWRWRARWAEAEAYAAWDTGDVAEVLRHVGRARAELVGVRVDDADADALEARWRVIEVRCMRVQGSWERARGALLAAIEAVPEPRGAEARVLRGLLAASAMGEGDAVGLARAAQGGDQVAKVASVWSELLSNGDVAHALERLEGAPFEPWAHALAQLARRRLGAAVDVENAPRDHEDPRGDLLRELAAPLAPRVPLVPPVAIGRWDAVAERVRGLGDASAEAIEAVTRLASAGGFAVPWGLAPPGVLEAAEALARARMGDAPWVLTTRAGTLPLDASLYATYAEGLGPETVIVVVPETRIFVGGERLDVGQKRVLVPLFTALLVQADTPLSMRELAAIVWRVRGPQLKPAVQTKIKVAMSRLRTLLGRGREVVVTAKKAEGGAKVAAYQIAPGVSFAVIRARG